MARAARPSLVVIAGPNGAGKSTLAPVLLKDTLSVTEFVNADVIARGISAFAPENVAIAAGRLMLGRLRELAKQRTSFAFETTLASRSFAPWIRRLVEADGQRPRKPDHNTAGRDSLGAGPAGGQSWRVAN